MLVTSRSWLMLALALSTACGDRVLPEAGESADDTSDDTNDSETGGEPLPEPLRLFAGAGTCAVLDGSRLKCWGDNRDGLLGMGVWVDAIGDDEHPSVLSGVGFPSNIVDVATFWTHGCALEASGVVHCWGRWSPALGFAWPWPWYPAANVGDDETMLDAPALDLGDGVIDVAVGYGFSCVLYGEGGVRCWGASENGQTGYGTTQSIDPLIGGKAPKDLPFVDVGAPVKALSASYLTICAVTHDGHVKCWGGDVGGTLGQGITPPGQYWSIGDDDVPADYPPIALPGAPVSAVSSGYSNTCALHEDGAITCWGRGRSGYGAAGDAVGEGYGDDESPVSLGHVDVGGPAKAVMVGGFSQAYVLLEQGDVRCFDPLSPDPPAASPPVDLGGPVVELSVGDVHACAVLENGDVRCWGDGGTGALGYASVEDIGDDETPASMPPVQIE